MKAYRWSENEACSSKTALHMLSMLCMCVHRMRLIVYLAIKACELGTLVSREFGAV